MALVPAQPQRPASGSEGNDLPGGSSSLERFAILQRLRMR
jgi:hypothetical protein